MKGLEEFKADFFLHLSLKCVLHAEYIHKVFLQFSCKSEITSEKLRTLKENLYFFHYGYI